MKAWDWEHVVEFAISICVTTWFLLILSTFLPNVPLKIPIFEWYVSLSFVVGIDGTVIPGIFLLAIYQESRQALCTFEAVVAVYIFAILTGFCLPFISYLGSGNNYPLWDSSIPSTLVRVFFINLLLTPLWEEAIWRGYFYSKVNTLVARTPAMLISALAWAVWHFGYLVFL